MIKGNVQEWSQSNTRKQTAFKRINCGIFIYWNITQLWEWTNPKHIQQHRWISHTPTWAKATRYKRTTHYVTPCLQSSQTGKTHLFVRSQGKWLPLKEQWEGNKEEFQGPDNSAPCSGCWLHRCNFVIIPAACSWLLNSCVTIILTSVKCLLKKTTVISQINLQLLCGHDPTSSSGLT